MAIMIGDCPRCAAQRTTFDIMRTNQMGANQYEAFSVCRHCGAASILILILRNDAHPHTFDYEPPEFCDDSLNQYLQIKGLVTVKDLARYSPPDYVPDNIANAFKEAVTCLSVQCWNAAGAMFRLCVDLATKPKVPQNAPPSLIKTPLGPRLDWLFKNGVLPEELEPLSSCIKDDGNDGVHVGALKKEDAEDLLDFTTQLLERMFTTPERLKLAEKRRMARRVAGRRSGGTHGQLGNS
jgi:hypothetical protein